jgi:hypothetical protein
MKNRRMKEKRKARKEDLKLEGKNKLLSLQKELLTMKKQIKLLSNGGNKSVLSRNIKYGNRPALFSHRCELSAKQFVLEKVDDKVKRLNSSMLSIKELSLLGEGCFGIVKAIRLHNFSMTVAAKTMKGSTRVSILSEALLMEVVSGHVNFPFLHGLMDDRTIIMELIGNYEGDVVSVAPTLKTVLKQDVTKKYISVYQYHSRCYAVFAWERHTAQ